MKKLGYFLSLLIILSACTSGVAQKSTDGLSISTPRDTQKSSDGLSASTSGVTQKPNDVIIVPDSPLSSPQGRAASDTLVVPPLEIKVSQVGEALTPFQVQLEQTLNQRKAAGLPVPSSVKFEYQATSERAMQQIAGATTHPTAPAKVISKTVVIFDSPEQAGYDEWPALIVEDNLPSGTPGTVREGDYTEAYRKFMEKKIPGFWEKYKFGHEPRTHTITETIEITYPKENLLASDSTLMADMTATQDILMGFTYTGPHLDYSIEDSWSDPIFGIEVYYFKAGFDLDWALGLRLPGQADLTGPDQLVAGSPYLFASAMKPLDWSAAKYSGTGVASENGNEFVLRMNFFVGVEGHLIGIDLCSWCHVTVDKDFSTSFTTPFGPGAFFPIPSVNIPIYEFDLAVFYFGAGLKVDPNLGSDKITANWQANGDASGSGIVTYSNPGTPISFGPAKACNLGADNLAQIQLDGFRYWFNQFLIELSASLNFELFGYGVWNPSYSIISLDLSSLTDGLYLDKHVQCEWDFTCSEIGPDNMVNLSIPVIDLTPPATILTPSGTAGNNSWYISDVQVSLNATDLPAGCGIGVKQTEYSFDGASWNIYTGPFAITNEGMTTVYYRSIDSDNNVELTKTQTVKIDKTPPTITGAPTTAPNAYGWYNTDVVVHFDASDVISGIDTVTPDQILSGEGVSQSVTGVAVDMAGLTTSFTVTGINIDKTSPNLSITSPEARVYENTETFNIIWSATDSLSGIASENGIMDGVATINGQLIELLLFGPGPHTMALEAIDKANNTSSASVIFSVSVDSEGLLAAIKYMCDLGWINKHGICNSLDAKVNAAIESINRGNLNAAENQLNAFLNELEAQKDKSINQSAYDVLKADVLYVIDHLAEEP